MFLPISKKLLFKKKYANIKESEIPDFQHEEIFEILKAENKGITGDPLYGVPNIKI